MDDTERIFGLYATVSRLSNHCFKLCDSNPISRNLPQNEIQCIQRCVKHTMNARDYVGDRINTEYPEAKHYNKSLEFTSVVDFT